MSGTRVKPLAGVMLVLVAGAFLFWLNVVADKPDIFEPLGVCPTPMSSGQIDCG